MPGTGERRGESVGVAAERSLRAVRAGEATEGVAVREGGASSALESEMGWSGRRRGRGARRAVDLRFGAAAAGGDSEEEELASAEEEEGLAERRGGRAGRLRLRDLVPWEVRVSVRSRMSAAGGGVMCRSLDCSSDP